MNLFFQQDIKDEVFNLNEEESRHAVKVLRLAVGDELLVADGKGTHYHCQLTNTSRTCTLKTLRRTTVPRSNHHIHIAIAPTKNSDRIEWFVEKAVELGIDRISFILCDHSERKKINVERLEKIATGALKQSFRYWLPGIDDMVPIAKILTAPGPQKIIAHLDEHNPVHLKNMAKAETASLVLIGPEGDFSPDELQAAATAGFKMASLGPYRLRTETAALAACHILNLLNEK